uniref:capping protein inhibiting regulator of actin dynamics n=1 Tax=Scatophagus argus TaxID=75038 RepID=UPI001ED84C85|nr:capping protein inhibiting regulator of actin dynamics [Scatophagus argus]
MSQENVSDKVRNLQKQIAQGIKFGQRPPSLRKSEGDEGSSDEEEVPRSPMKVLAQVEAEPVNTEPKQVHGAQQAEPHSTPVKSPRSKRVLPPTGTIESINLDAVPQSVPLLDNTAAKHKLSVKPKNQRISRKHRRFTQDLQEVSIPGVVQEDLEATGFSKDDRCRTSTEESLENFKKQRLHEEERQKTKRKRELEEQRLKQEEEETRKRAAEELRLRELEEERSRKQQEEEERKLREEAERGRREEEERRIKEEVERRQREEEERMQREEEERRLQEEEEERRQQEEERRRLEEQKRKEEEERRKQEEEEEARRQQEAEAAKKRRLREEEDERNRKEEAEKLRLQEIEEKKKMEAEERLRKEEEEQRRLSLEEADDCSDPQERKRRAEELRWREMEERQRPFSFKVSSGEKQILFQKVNLTPVTPASSHQSGAVARESAKVSSSEEPESPNLPTSPYVPHTAILVTGAQLCGTAVNLDQIKDTACKSLLGLGEDRKAQGTPPTKSKTSPDRKSGKTKSLNEASFSPDQSGAAVLAEWASIRSKIFKGVEEGKYDDYPDPSKNHLQSSSEEQPAFSHTNLRKTMSASAKFSITPAKKKFGDSNRNSEVFGADDKDMGEETTMSDSFTAASTASTSKPQNRTSKTVRIAERGSEECMFAKDLPSFLVPSPGAKPEGPELKSRAQSETGVSESREEGEDRVQDSEEKPSPFGIKLRRTNYSLRFHSEQSTEKRKKRYSAGDSFDGVPSPLTPIEPDSDASSVFSDKSSPTSPQKEGAVGKYLNTSASPATPRAKPRKSTSPITPSEGEKVLSKPPLYRRPTTSPKPVGAVPTPPPSPLPKVTHGPPSDAVIQRTGAAGLSSEQLVNRSEEPSIAAHLHQSSRSQVHMEEEPKEKRSFFPSINIPWREKVDRKTELIRREKPSLQSRHSLDSSRVQEKEAGPLWITLALQKQKGFREQQQNREERRSQRESKLVEKQARDSVTLVSPTESKGSGSTSPSSKPQTPEEPKRPDSLLGRFERREHLKKANTLPSSVTVEIADSTPSPPAVKEVSKRFPSSDSPQVSTEPAWLALAKRKAKAWSDCPQIIK